MKSVRIHQYGSPEIISFEDAPIPEITPAQVLIQVYATSFNPLDSLLVRGVLKDRAPLEFPFTLCSDVSGVITKMGSAVSGLKKGGGYLVFWIIPKMALPPNMLLPKLLIWLLRPGAFRWKRLLPCFWLH